MKRKQIRQLFYLDILIAGNVKSFKKYLNKEENLGSDCNTPELKRALTFLEKASEKAVFYLAMKYTNVRLKKESNNKKIVNEVQSIMKEIYDYNLTYKKAYSESVNVMDDDSLEGLPDPFIDILMQGAYLFELFYDRHKDDMDDEEKRVLGELLKRGERIFKIFYDYKIIWRVED